MTRERAAVTEAERTVVPSGRTPIRHVKASEFIIDELRRMAVRHGVPGDYLPSERALVEKFEVSRPTIREAIRVLESEGLVEVRRGVRGGAVIRDPSINDMARRFGVFLQAMSATGDEVFAVRRIVEPHAAALAAARPDLAREPLELALSREAAQLDDIDGDHSISVNIVNFHDTVLDLSGNRVLASVAKLLDVLMTQHAYEELTAFRNAGPAERSAALKRSHAAHKRIAKAILEGEPSRAERLMTDHLVALAALSPEAAERSIDILGPSLEDSAAHQKVMGAAEPRYD